MYFFFPGIAMTNFFLEIKLHWLFKEMVQFIVSKLLQRMALYMVAPYFFSSVEPLSFNGVIEPLCNT